ncbi:MAG: hypothetical protein Q7V88_14615 [Actinomycetota bacterium]|nr:hypothetical protein [Actinomycetota bacterium]
MSDSADGFLPPTPPVPSTPPSFQAPPPAFGAPQSVVIDVAPSPAPRKRTPRIAVAAAVAVVGAGVGVYAATRGSDSEGERFSLKAAAAEAEAATSVAFELTMDMGSLGNITMTSRIDTEAQRMAFDMETSAAGQDISISAVMDMAAKVMYMDAAALIEQGADVPTKFVSIDVSDNPQMAASMDSATGNNPLDIAPLFASADKVEDLGTDTVNGEEVKHYKVTVDIAKVLEAQPQLQEQLDQAGGDMPDEIVYDVYVTADNQLRRMAFDMELMGQSISTDIVVTAVGNIEPIELPDPADVTDIAEITGG